MYEDNVCARCGKEFYPRHFHSNGVPLDTGYGEMQDGTRVCFECCALDDLETMRQKGKITLYLSKKGDEYIITNWPGTLRIKPGHVKKSRHNIGHERIDTWFGFEGYTWHVYQIGKYNEIAHCKRTKEPAKNNSVILPDN